MASLVRAERGPTLISARKLEVACPGYGAELSQRLNELRLNESD
jgi:hypothetical protein